MTITESEVRDPDLSDHDITHYVCCEEGNPGDRAFCGLVIRPGDPWGDNGVYCILCATKERTKWCPKYGTCANA